MRHAAAALTFLSLFLSAAEPPNPRILTEPWKSYFERQVSAIEGQLEREVQSKEDWLAKKDEYRRQLAEMLSLDPLPPRSDLKVSKTGEFEQDGVIVENLSYQSMPGLYVTANLYRPKQVDKPLPAILYGCGHSNMMKDGVSYGNKAGYEHHGMWYAKHGFVCLVYDTVQLGEIRGEHHGTYSKGRWWWIARGYTPAGLEAWSGIRGLDYLETRPEVDKTRLGVTGRSGGGAYSWWVAALDERIKAAAPTAGITTLRNHVIDGCVAGHCDCMYMVNTYQWDYDKVAALVAPRALLIANTDKDEIFPIDGVFKIYQSTRRIYKLLGAEHNLGIQFAEGPHKDTQPLNTGEFHWMTRMLQGADILSTLDSPAVKLVPMEKLQVFKTLPTDERNTKIDESFVAVAKPPEIPANEQEWGKMRDAWVKALKAKCFPAQFTPDSEKSIFATRCAHESTRDIAGLRFVTYSIGGSGLVINLVYRNDIRLEEIQDIDLHILDEQSWDADHGVSHTGDAFRKEKKRLENSKSCSAYFCPTGIGPLSLPADSKSRTQLLRRFYLVGETLEGKQMRDIRCAIRALRDLDDLEKAELRIKATDVQAINILYASLFEKNISSIELSNIPQSHTDGPTYLNVMKYLDIPQALAMAAERTRIIIHGEPSFDFAFRVSEKFNWSKDKNRGIEFK